MIGGNIMALIQLRTVAKNAIGEAVEQWHDVTVLKGWLDLSGGEAKSSTYNAKIQESTHIFIGDYQAIPSTVTVDGKSYAVNAESTRAVIGGSRYDVLLIDDPMEMHKQLEIYLKYTGGQ